QLQEEVGDSGIPAVKRLALTRGGYTLVDDSEFDRLRAVRWYKTSHGYAATRSPQFGSGAVTYLHRLLLCPPDGMTVDHINGDKLDNRKANLRICLPGENVANRPSSRGGRGGARTSVYRGVHLTRDGR